VRLGGQGGAFFDLAAPQHDAAVDVQATHLQLAVAQSACDLAGELCLFHRASAGDAIRCAGPWMVGRSTRWREQTRG